MVPKKDGEHSPDTGGVKVAALRSLCIVVADDDRDAVLSLSMLLQAEGHEVHTAYSEKQTLDQVLRHDPDALLLDIALGQGSGFRVANTIRDRHGNARPMIIGLSGIFRKSSDRILADINGFNYYMVKPYEPHALLALLQPLRQPRRRVEHEQQEQTYRAAVARAASVVGGARELSQRLHVSMTDLTRWLAGEDKPTIDVFLRVVDILVKEGHRAPTGAAASGQMGELRKMPDAGA